MAGSVASHLARAASATISVETHSRAWYGHGSGESMILGRCIACRREAPASGDGRNELMLSRIVNWFDMVVQTGNDGRRRDSCRSDEGAHLELARCG